MSFWSRILENRKKKGDLAPFFCLAPMSDVTDCAFRKILVHYGKPDVMWTEFVAADGISDKLGRKKLSHILKFSENERPIVAQVFGANPERMEVACRYIASLGFDGIDINMGCPDKSVISQGAGAAMIRTPELAKKIIDSARKGVRSAGVDLPISVKTRIGFNKEQIDEWIAELLKENLPVLTIHLRTKKEESLVPAHWELMERIVKLRDKISPETLIIGNGDIKNREEGIAKARETGCDGIMIGRGFFGNPWLLSQNLCTGIISVEKRLQVLLEHIDSFERLLGKDKNFDVMKKHFKSYVSDFVGAKELRVKLMMTKNCREAKKLINTELSRIRTLITK